MSILWNLVQKCQIKIRKKKIFRVTLPSFGTRSAFTPVPLWVQKHYYISRCYNTKTFVLVQIHPKKCPKINPFDKMLANRLFFFLFVNHSPVFYCKMLLVCAFPCQNVTSSVLLLLSVCAASSKKNAFFLQKVCYYFVVSKKSIIFV